MKRRKLAAIIEATIARTRATDAMAERPVTIDQLAICWSKRTVSFRGRVVEAGEQDVIIFPLLTTDRLVIPANQQDDVA
jgi:hypothetical protein